MSKRERKHLEATTIHDKTRNRLDVIREWLSENYVVRVNLLDRNKRYILPTENCSVKYEFAVTEEDIFLHAYADELKISQNTMRMLLNNPNYMQSFNPVTDYLESLRGKYTGPSQIDLLCSSLHVSDENGGIEAEQRAARLLRKWLIATAACAMGIRQNDVALGLVGCKAGIGKTTFFENLVPPCLKEYYLLAMRENKSFSFNASFAQRFLINFDEFAAITKNNEQEFKQMMSAKEVEMRRPQSRYMEKVPRVASCCFTSNKNHVEGGFISKPDAGILRRLAVIEVDTIDDYRGELNIDQLWAEVMLHLDGGVDYVWSQKDYQAFVNENRQYVMETNALRLLQLYYRMPLPDEEGQFMTAMEIVLQLKEKKKLSSEQQRVSEVTIGQALTVLGYQRHIRRMSGVRTPRYGYYIIPMFDNNRENE